MNSIRKPLLFLDAHANVPQKAFDLAVAHAKASNAPLRIVDAIDDTSWAKAFAGPQLDVLFNRIIEQKQTVLDKAAAVARDQGVDTSVEVLRGAEVSTVVRDVIDGGHDILYKTMLGDPNVRGRRLGNAARRLLRKCPSAVCLVHPEFSSVQRVVAAVGPETESGDEHEMNDAVLSTAALVGSIAHAEVHALQAWELYGEAMLREHFDTEDLLAQVRAQQDAALKALQATCARGEYPIRPDRVHLLEGPTEDVIADYANSSAGDLLVLGSHARSGLKGMLLGNTAEMLLDSINCSVLTLKLPDFVSPLA